MMTEPGSKFAYLVCFVVASLAVTGYFIGLQSPMNPTSESLTTTHDLIVDLSHHSEHGNGSGVIAATQYADMGAATSKRAMRWKTSLADLKVETDPLAEVKILPGQKAFALEMREQNRAFNGAPPTVPHAIDQMSAASCLACHGDGIKTASLRIPKMSHQFLANCTQCHVANELGQGAEGLFRENLFVGLPAPTGGPRSYPGAPPMIPHSTWMRVNCLSCHGSFGQQGLRTTHPWRQNCQQCHAPSSTLEQVPLDAVPSFLSPPQIDP